MRGRGIGVPATVKVRLFPAEDHRMVPIPTSGVCRSAVAVLSAVVLSVLMPLPASAHSSGQLPNATLRADGRTVVVEWTAAADDTADVGVALGLLPETAVDAYLGTGPFDDIPTPAQVERLSQSHALREYLLERIQVRQHGVACTGTAQPAADFISDGARVTFTCAEPVDQVALRITVLHDRDPGYATYSVDGTQWYALHTTTMPEHTWDAAAARGSRGAGPVVGVGAALIGVVALGGLGLRLSRAPRRRASLQ